MKKVVASVMALGIIVSGVGLFVNETSALEQTISIKEINYVSLQQMGAKYNYAVYQNKDLVSITGEAVNLTVPLKGTVFTLNGNEYVAQTPAEQRNDQTWISAKDWAEMFKLSLTHYDKVSQMQPTKTKPVTHDAELDRYTYTVSDEWGEKVPEGVRKHGSPTNIKTPHIELPIYESKHLNEEKESSPQVR